MGNQWSGRRRTSSTAANNFDSKVLSGWADSMPPNTLPGVDNNLDTSVSPSHTKTDDQDDQLVQGITIYRSYSNVARPEPESYSTPSAGVSVYRSLKRARARVTWHDGSPVHDECDVRRRTLPRQFGRSKMVPGNVQRSETLPSSTGARIRRQPPAFDMLDSEWTDRAHDMDDDEERLSTGRTSSRRRRSCYQVNNDDFPSITSIKRRLEQFETDFARDVATMYAELTETVQLNTLSIAVKRDDTHRRISLSQFINCPDVAAELHAGPSTIDSNDATIDYCLTVSPDHFRFILDSRRDRKHVTELVRRLVEAIACTAAGELARVYEYQLALLGDGLAAGMLAAHAARCVIDYVISSGRYLEPDTVVMGVVKGHARPVRHGPVPIISVIIGERELKWRLDEILKKPGLRREIYLCSHHNNQDSDTCPWVFLTSPHHDAELYGYRGLLLERTYDMADSSVYHHVSGDDETVFTTLARSSSDDEPEFHRRYRPYHRLIAGSPSGPRGPAADGCTAEWRPYARDEMKTVHRRLGPMSFVVSSSATSDNDL